MKSTRRLLLVVVTWASVAFRPIAAAEDASVTAKLEKDQVTVSIAGSPFTAYNFAPTLKKPYLYPVIGPKSGKSVTVESVPGQYPHHNSIWFGCDRVNGGNYWAPPDNIQNGQIKSLGPKIVQAEGKAVIFTDECLWQKPGAEPVIRDARRITITAPSADLRLIDFDVTLHMLTDVTVQKTNHSLFSVRVAPELSVKSGGTLMNAEGNTGEKGTFGVASPWCDYYGTRDGVTEGAALFDHPTNRWHPCKWFTRDYGFMSPTPMFWPPDGKEIRFPKGEAVSLRYRVVVHAGDAKQAGIAELFAQYAKDTGTVQPDDVIEKLKTYEFGQSREPLIAVTDMVRAAQDSLKAKEALEDRLIALLQSDATFSCKQFICELLSEFGTERAVPALATLLIDEKLSNAARFALERMPSPKAGEALRSALGSLTGRLQIGVVNSLATRRDRESVPELTKLAGSQDKALAAAAIEALGRVGGQEAAKALSDLTVADDLTAVKADALLCCATQMCAAGETGPALAVYDRLIGEGNPREARIGALEGIVRVEKEKALPRILTFLKDTNPALRLAAAKFAANIPGEAATKSLAGEMPSLSADTQVTLLTSLAGRGDKAAAPAAANLVESPEEDVRISAVRALGVLGDASHVMLLAKIAAAGGAVGGAAVESLNLLAGDGVNEAMVKGMKGAEPGVRVALINALVARDCDGLVPILFDAVKEYDPNVHKAVCKALASEAGKDDLGRMVEMLVATENAAARRDLEQAISAAVARINDPNTCADPVIAALEKANDEAKIGLLAVLNRIGVPAALAAVQSQLTSSSPTVKRAAIHALAEWPDATPMAELLKIARTETNEVHQVLALRGFIRQATMLSERSDEETARLLREAMELAKRPDEEKAILAVLPNYPCAEALALAESRLNDEQVAEEAKLAFGKLKRTADEGRKFDFQGKDCQVMEGFIKVNASTAYDEERGYGWLKPPSGERDRKKGTNLTRDFIFDRAPQTFRVKVPNGAHVVTVFLGDMATGHDNMEVRAEGQVGLQNVTSKGGEVKELFFEAHVEDGALDIEFRDAGGNDPNWTCAGLIVGK
ncbi:MAG: DUF6807 family protein [Planctomycetota bacterium]